MEEVAAPIAIGFEEFPKIYRLNRDICITEKIDGTNGAVIVTEAGEVAAQSRNRLVTPGKTTDHHGFAEWVEQNAEGLRATLGPGRHFGEWWGCGIARNYGLQERRFSLFNAKRWRDADLSAVGALRVVPVVYEGSWTEAGLFVPHLVVGRLAHYGSSAAPGFMRPEGIVVYHKASAHLYKVTVQKDEEWKGKAADTNR